MQIRTATSADLAAVVQIEAECFPAAEAATELSLARRLALYPNHFWVLMDGKQLVGFVNGMATDEPDLRDEMYDDAALHNENGAWQMIFGVDTIPAYRRRGCAAMLLECTNTAASAIQHNIVDQHYNNRSESVAKHAD